MAQPTKPSSSAPLPLQDASGFIGYAAVMLFSIVMFVKRAEYPFDIFASTIVIAALALLATFYYRKATLPTHPGLEDPLQRRLRIAGHLSMMFFYSLTVSRFSMIHFLAYDAVALVAHGALLYAVIYGLSQKPGAAILIAYLFLAAYSSFSFGGIYLIRAIGCVILVYTYIGMLVPPRKTAVPPTSEADPPTSEADGGINISPENIQTPKGDSSSKVDGDYTPPP